MLRRGWPVAVAILGIAAGSIPVAAPVAGSERKTVAYRGVAIEVPADWPVVDLNADRWACARFDVSAVYLGRQGAQADCPAVVIGAAAAVRLMPRDRAGEAMLRRAPRRLWNGEPARVLDGGPAGGWISVALEGAGAIVQVTHGVDRALAEQIASSARPAGVARLAGASRASPAAVPPVGEAAAGPIGRSTFQAASAQPAPLQPGIFAGDAFDTCANPSLEKMSAWLASPYRAIGIYVGGINHGCKAQTLDADWVSSVARMGWALLPLYVGLQAPCYARPTAAKIDPSRAGAQGREAADDAIARADLLGLPTGALISFDMEAYSGDASCVSAVHAFLEAWTVRLHERGYLSGVYSSEASGIANLADAVADPAFAGPDAIWTAHWGESKRIFGHNQSWLSDTLWTEHQRLHQYRGGHVETWGGQSITIDSDLADAPAVRFAAAPRWVVGNVDGAGGTDLVHLCCRDYANVWMSEGDGSFAVRSFRPWPRYGLQAGSFLPLDVDGDARSDLVHLCCADYVNVWRSRGDGTYAVSRFRPWAGYGLGVGRWIVSDVDGDGADDLVHACCRDYVNVWLSRRDGTFTVKPFRPWRGYGARVGAWMAADVNGDGSGDLVHVCCRDYAHAWVSRGDGTYAVAVARAWPGYGMQIGRWLAADVDADGDADLVHLCCADYAHIWLSRGDGAFSVRFFRPWAGYGMQGGRWLVADPDGDGKDDLVHVCCRDYLNLWTSRGDGSYAIRLHRPWEGYGMQAGSWGVGDADADGRDDLVHLCCPAHINTWMARPDGGYAIVASPV